MKIELVQIVFMMLMYLLLISKNKNKRITFFFNYFLYRKHTVDFEFQALLKRHFTRVMYFDATVMDPVDLDRVKVIDRYYAKKNC